MKEDLNNNKIKTIIVKDLSRLGRHNAKVQLFLENIYEVDKRVISLGDNYDTLNENSISTYIYLLNCYYANDCRPFQFTLD